MSRIKGHALRRGPWDEDAKAFVWSCECGHEIGNAPVHGARALWREHKAATAGPGPVAEET